MTATKTKKGRGRPKGSKTEDLPIVDVSVSLCSKCKSTERTRYYSIKTMEYSGTTLQGNPYNFISWKRTTCKKCGQNRIDKFYENVV